jgi:hypothetical protein
VGFTYTLAVGYNIFCHMEKRLMDTQLNNYIVLRNGKRVSPAMTLEKCIQSVQWREKKLDRATEHSPYTIGKVENEL